VAVSGDRDAEALVRLLTSSGYRVTTLVEQEAASRLATVRLIPPGRPSLVVDLLFASSGIEPEIVAAAEPLEIIEGATVRVAIVPHLIAMKVLARNDVRRPQDRIDLTALLAVANESDLEAAREALRAIEARGFHRGRNLLADLQALLA
jgi:hypothetical protein